MEGLSLFVGITKYKGNDKKDFVKKILLVAVPVRSAPFRHKMSYTA